MHKTKKLLFLSTFLLVATIFFINSYFFRSNVDTNANKASDIGDIKYTPYVPKNVNDALTIDKIITPEGAMSHTAMQQLEAQSYAVFSIIHELSSHHLYIFKLENNSNKTIVNVSTHPNIYLNTNVFWLPIPLTTDYAFLLGPAHHLFPNEYQLFKENIYDGLWGQLLYGEYAMLRTVMTLQEDDNRDEITVVSRFTIPFTDFIRSNISHTPTNVLHEGYVACDDMEQLLVRQYIAMEFAPELTAQNVARFRLFNHSNGFARRDDVPLSLYKRYNEKWFPVPIIEDVPHSGFWRFIQPNSYHLMEVNIYNGIYGHLSAGDYAVIIRDAHWVNEDFTLGDEITVAARFTLPFVIPAAP
ncbi:MAG: hypothetical protein FWC16_00285 [Defluviitaleaceae bacterium]|nr:hypothetical protein [Defluviitaleaceae bacterium]MCL2273340.1 hypothetical protein [Defluviitaleaceae bacterium]